MKGTILALAVAGALMLGGCGGGGSRSVSMTPTPEPEPTLTPAVIAGLPEGHSLESGTIPVGQSETVYGSGGVRVVAMCTGADCAIEVSDNGIATVTGGRVTISVTTPEPTGEDQFAHLAVEPPLVDWRELPTLIGRMNHRTQVRSSDFPGLSCDGGVADCQAVVKEMLANARKRTEAEDEIWVEIGIDTEGWFTADKPISLPGTPYSREYWGGWLNNSIFIVEQTGRPDGEGSPPDFDSGNTWTRMISMGIRDTNPVVGVYRGSAVMPLGSVGHFELTYTRGATGGQLNLEIDFPASGYPVTWSNIPVDNEGAFDNGIQQITPADGPGKVEGRFYQGGEVGGVFVNKSPIYYHHFGAFGGKLVPDGP